MRYSQSEFTNPIDCRGDFSNTVGLLISVTGVREARLVSSFDVDVIDLKDPRMGPLGACKPQLWAQCVEEVPFSGNWSVALGESDHALQIAGEVPAGIQFAKVGPSELMRPQQILAVWQGVRHSLPQATELVPVAYADYQSARCAAPEAMLELAANEGYRTFLIDTFDKSSLGTLQVLGTPRLQSLAKSARERNIDLVVAGKLKLVDLDILRHWKVSRVGIRGAVCPSGRTGAIEGSLVEQWVSEIGKIV